MAMSMLLPVPDDDHCVVCPTCETLVAQRFSWRPLWSEHKKKAGWNRSAGAAGLTRLITHRYHRPRAFEAIARTLPLGSVGEENEANRRANA